MRERRAPSKSEQGRVAEEPENRYMPSRPVKVSEHIIQLLWRNGLYNKSNMKTTCGIPLEIVKPGRLNKSAGPDFKNALIIIGNQKKTGDVEIHLQAKSWYDHNHHLSPLYNNTILHVFLSRRENTTPAVNKNGKTVPELELGVYLRHSLEELQTELEDAESPITGRPHAPPCSRILEKAGGKSVEYLLDLVADGRMLIKSNRIIDRLEKTNPDQLLYEIFFECLGYTRFTDNFRKLARLVPLETLRELVKKNTSLSPYLTAQAVFFEISGLIDGATKTDADAELMELIGNFEKVRSPKIERAFRLNDWQLGGCRPVNYPQRRVAAFSHLAITECDFKRIANLMSNVPADSLPKDQKKFVRGLLEKFTETSDPFWNRRYTFNRPARTPKKLIGKDRAVSLLVDCIIPFCLAVSRQKDDAEFEHKLVTIYHAVPKPSSNAIIDFMKRNMFGKGGGFAVKTVLHQQALIQLYKDFCFLAPAGCKGCAFLELLKMPVWR